MIRLLVACAGGFGLVGFACDRAPSPADVVAAPVASASAPAAVAAAPVAVAAAVPNWTVNGSDPASGRMVLRCENAFPPEDQSGKCMCQGYELGICVDGSRQLMIDRKQCGFICKPRSSSAREVALRCPDGATPAASAQGCACSGRKPLDPCAGGIASTKVVAGECVVTCKAAQ